MTTTLNQSKQSFAAIGLVSEFELIHESCEVITKDKEGNTGKTIDSERIRGKISINIGSGIKTFDVFCTRHTKQGEESKQWKNAESWLELTPTIISSITTNFGTEEKNNIIGDKDNASLVSVSGRINENRYYNSNIKDVSVNLRWNATRISTNRVNPDDTFGCTLSGNFFIKSIVHEMVNDEDTGRLKVSLVSIGYGADPIIIDAIVNEDLAEAFEDLYEVNQTVSFDMDVIFEHIGGNTSTQKAFGKAGAIKSTGYDKEILIITGGDEPIEESDLEDEDGNVIDNGYLNPKAIKTALKEREIALAEIKNNEGAENKATKSKSNLKEKKRLGAKKTITPIEDEDDSPFDDEDDDF